MDKNYIVKFPEPKKIELACEEIPEIGDNEFLLKTITSQISMGTELTILMGDVDADSTWKSNLKYPATPGYSNVSRVIKVGKNVDPALLGKRFSCGATHRMYHVANISRFENENDTMIEVPENVSDDEAAFATLARVAMASIRAREVRPGSVALVFGAGIVGQMVARLAKVAGAVKVIVADVSDNRLSYVPKEPGFITVNSANVDIISYIEELTESRKADIVYETTGNAGLADMELRCVARRGALIITSSPKSKSLIDLNYCNSKGITIIGAHNWAIHTKKLNDENRWNHHNEGKYVLELMSHKNLHLEEMVTRHVSYKDAVSIYEQLMVERTGDLAIHFDWE